MSRKKRIKDNVEYVKLESGAIVLDSKSKYNEFIRQRSAKIAEKNEIISLRSEIEELKELVNSLAKKGKK